MAKWIRVSGEVSDVTPANGKHFSLAEMQRFVGGYIEIIPAQDPLFSLVINEEGKLNGLPRNETATSMTRGVVMPGDFVVGDVLIISNDEIESA